MDQIDDLRVMGKIVRWIDGEIITSSEIIDLVGALVSLRPAQAARFRKSFQEHFLGRRDGARRRVAKIDRRRGDRLAGRWPFDPKAIRERAIELREADLSCAKIAKTLNREGYWPSGRAKAFTAAAVRRMFAEKPKGKAR